MLDLVKEISVYKYLLPIILVCIWSCETDSKPEDCLGVEGGTAYVDSCGTCDDDLSKESLILDIRNLIISKLEYFKW